MISSVEVLTCDDEMRWRQALEEVGRYDFYYLPEYHRLAERSGEGAARLIVCRDKEWTLLLPLLLRPVDELSGLNDIGEGWRDATSVYGYTGPLAGKGGVPLDGTQTLPTQTQRSFATSIEDILHEQKIVAVFSRLHPLFEQAPLLSGLGEVIDLGPTISIDLTQPTEEQWLGYRKTTRNEIRRLAKGGFWCVEDTTGEYWPDFISSYYETMARAHAQTMYFFTQDYFDYLRTSMGGNVRLFVCKKGESIASSALFVLCNDIVQYHLSASRNDCLSNISPVKLLMNTARQWANEQGASVLHLGGGIGSTRDSLFQFKQSFSSHEHTFRIWRNLLNPEVCEQLYRARCRRTGVDPSPTSYFPSYRDPHFAQGSQHTH